MLIVIIIMLLLFACIFLKNFFVVCTVGKNVLNFEFMSRFVNTQ